MRSRDDLFQLTKAMSRSEKRYFVLDAKKSGRSSSRYLKLFDLLSGMEELDEAKLKKKFPKNLSSDKAYLYEAILRSMRDYRSSASKAAQVKERLLDARYLHERGLYAQSNTRILEAKKLATELEDNFSLLEIIREEQLSLYDRRMKVGVEQIEELQREKDAVLKGVIEELDYIGLYFRLAVEVFGRGVLQGGQSFEGLKKELPMELLERGDLPQSPLAERRFYLSSANFFRLEKDNTKTYHFCEKAVQWWDGYPEIKEEEFYRYVGDVTNLVKVCYTDERLLDKADFWYEKLRKEAKGRNHHEKKYVFLSLSVANLLNYMNRGDIERTKKLLPEIIAGLEEFGLKRSLLLMANIIIAYFWLGDYASCEHWCGQLLSLKKVGREDIHRVVLLFKLVSLYEQGKIDELESNLRSAERVFRKLKVGANSFDNQVLRKHLKLLFNAPLGEKKKRLLLLKGFLEKTRSGDSKKTPLGLGEFELWVNQKLNPRHSLVSMR